MNRVKKFKRMTKKILCRKCSELCEMFSFLFQVDPKCVALVCGTLINGTNVKSNNRKINRLFERFLLATNYIRLTVDFL